MELGFDVFGPERSQRIPDFVRDYRRSCSELTVPEAAYLRPRMFMGQKILQALHAVEIVGFRIEQSDDLAQISQKVAAPQIEESQILLWLTSQLPDNLVGIFNPSSHSTNRSMPSAGCGSGRQGFFYLL